MLQMFREHKISVALLALLTVAVTLQALSTVRTISNNAAEKLRINIEAKIEPLENRVQILENTLEREGIKLELPEGK